MQRTSKAYLYCSTRAAACCLGAMLALALGTGCRVAMPAREQAMGQAAPGNAAATFAVTRGLPVAPDPRLTPGAVLPVTRDDICVSGYSGKVRNVPQSVKKQAYVLYGIATHKTGEFEVDHLISLELGGSNSIKNLWPESYLTQPWNAHVKDVLENRLHADVCSNKIDLATAQHEIATDWIGSYKRIFKTNLPLTKAAHKERGKAARAHSRGQSRPREAAPAAVPTAAASGTAAPAAGNVWVNPRSHKYFRPGSPYYGKTARGSYMSESAAIKAGNVAAQGQ